MWYNIRIKSCGASLCGFATCTFVQMRCCISSYGVMVVSLADMATYGEVSEWFKELVLKTSDAKAPRVRISASPPLFKNSIVVMLVQIDCAANSIRRSTQVGRRGAPAKGVGRVTGARVQISPSPPFSLSRG